MVEVHDYRKAKKFEKLRGRLLPQGAYNSKLEDIWIDFRCVLSQGSQNFA